MAPLDGASAQSGLRWRAAAPLVVSLCVVALLGAGTVHLLGQETGQESGAAEGTQTDRASDLEEIARQLKELESLRSQVDRQATDLLGTVARNRVELELQELRVLEARTAHGEATRAVGEAEEQLQTLDGRSRKLVELIEARAQMVYRLGRFGYLRLLFEVDGGSDLLAGLRQVRFLLERDGRLLRDFRVAQSAWTEQLTRLEQARADVTRWYEEEEERSDVLVARRRDLDRSLSRLEKRRAAIAERVEELELRSERLALLMDLLAEAQDGQLDGRPIQDFRGVLDWPVEGEVSAEFGFKRDPVYGTRIAHNGIEIQSGAGASIGAVFPGRVIFAAPFKGMGSAVVVQHRGSALTLYAGLEALSVAEGDVLSVGSAVGTSLDQIYFEIRIERRAENPREWLR